MVTGHRAVKFVDTVCFHTGRTRRCKPWGPTLLQDLLYSDLQDPCFPSSSSASFCAHSLSAALNVASHCQEFSFLHCGLSRVSCCPACMQGLLAVFLPQHEKNESGRQLRA
jgi:hypothetical protein